MKRKKILRDSRSISTVNMIAVSIFALIFASASIVNVWILNENVDFIYRNPYYVTKNVNNITNVISNMEMRMDRMPVYDTAEEYTYVKEDIDFLKPQLINNIKYILSNYSGPAADTAVLEKKIASILSLQDTIIERANTYTGEGMKFEISISLHPLYKDAYEACNKIALTSEYSAVKTSEESTQTAAINTMLAVVLALTMVLVSVYLQVVVRKNNRKLVYHEHLFSLITENVDDVTLIYDLEEKEVEYASTNALRIFGYSSEYILDNYNTLFSEVYNEYYERIKELTADFKGISETAATEFQVRNPQSGELRWMQMRIYPIHTDKKMRKIIITITDLTDIKNSQNMLKDALAIAEKANEAKKEFLSRMSHEIRTPLNAIIGMTSIASHSTQDRIKTENCLIKIQYSSKHLLNIVNEILDMSAIESGKISITKEPFSIKELITSISSVYYEQCRQKKQIFRVYGSDIVHTVLTGDQFRLNQILLNLLSNAIKFTSEGGTVTLRIHELTSNNGQVYFRFSVEDSGIGMDSSFLSKVYNPFEQATASTAQKYGGTGLGLTITKSLIDLMGGTIDVTSEPGKGTVFHVELPFDISSKEIQIPLHCSFDKLQALIIDQDRESSAQTQSALKRLGVTTHSVSDTITALQLLTQGKVKNNPILCVINCGSTDEILPDTISQLRKAAGDSQIKTVVYAYSFSGHENELQKAGADYIMQHPAVLPELYRILAGDNLPESDARQESDNSYDFSNRRILLVEDNELNLEIALELLELTGLQIDTAADGREALDKFLASEAGRYDAMLLDIQLPFMDGYQVAKKIRSSPHPDARSLPIIAMTANAFSEDIVSALSAGMNGHIAKPIDTDVLYNTLKSFLHQ